MSLVSPHMLRRSWAHLHLNDPDNPLDSRLAMDALDHVSESTLRHYARPKDKRVNDVDPPQVHAELAGDGRVWDLAEPGARPVDESPGGSQREIPRRRRASDAAAAVRCFLRARRVSGPLPSGSESQST